MKSLKLLFWVNGSATSAAATRAQQFVQRLPSDWDIDIHYRPVPKWKGIFTFLQSAAQMQPDVIYVMDAAYTGVLAAYAAQNLWRCPWIVDTGDLIYELAKSNGSYGPWQLRLVRWIEQLTTNHADHLVVRGSYHQAMLQEQGIQKVTFIPDGVDLTACQPLDVTDLRSELGLGDTLVVGMVGTMSWSSKHQMCYGWDIVEALGLLREQPIKALLVGDGNGRARLEARSQALGIADRVVFTGQVPYADVTRYVNAMDICVSTQSNDGVGMVRTTGKLPMYLACGKYVVATDVGEAKKVLPNVGYLLPYQGVRDDQHPIRLAAHLQALVDHPEQLQIAQQARETASRHFDYNNLAQRVEGVCRSLAHSVQ